jgi:ferric-dicitrate binding protein FerR (iron transport regulator)
VYQSKIVLTNPALSTCMLTATFHDQSLDSVLKVIEATLNVTILKTASGIEISGNGCE